MRSATNEDRREVNDMKAEEADIEVVSVGDSTFYEVPELGTVAKVRKDILIYKVTLIWGPEEGMTDRYQEVSAERAHNMARRHAASLA
jgi:hypothetical protein